MVRAMTDTQPRTRQLAAAIDARDLTVLAGTFVGIIGGCLERVDGSNGWTIRMTRQRGGCGDD